MDEFILIFRHQDGNKVASPEQLTRQLNLQKAVLFCREKVIV